MTALIPFMAGNFKIVRWQMTKRSNKFLNGGISPLLFVGASIIVGSNAFFATTASAQSSIPCDQILPSCQTGNQTNDITQDQVGNVAASIVINGETVTIDVPNNNGGTSPVEITATDISSVSSAAGNVISATAANNTNLDYKSLQNLSGNVSASNSVTTTGHVPGMVYMVTSASGNSSQAETNSGDMSYVATQNVAASSQITATAAADTAPDMGSLLINTQASANTAAINKNNGLVSLEANQTNYGTVNANTNEVNCCNVDTMNTNSIATGNTTSSVSVNSTSYNYVLQNNYGDITSNTRQTVTNDNSDTTVTAQTAGNSAFNYNQFGYTEMNAAQYSGGNISSNARLDSAYFDGTVVVGSASQGNSTVMSSIGTSGALYATQETGAGSVISANTIFDTFTEYGVGYGTASASGNALAGFICAGCSTDSVSMNGTIYQENNAAEVATIGMSASGNGRLHSYGVAAGNSATIITQNGQSY